RNDVEEVSRRHQQRDADQTSRKNIAYRFLAIRLMHFGNRGYGPMSELLQGPVDPVQRIRRLLPRQPVDGFREQEKHDRQQNRRGCSAEVEHRTPVIFSKEARSKHSADSSSQRISDHHHRDTQAAPFLVRELCNDGIGTRKHATDAETGEYTPNRKLHRTRGCGRTEHAESHGHKTREKCGAAAVFVAYPADDNRADGHSDEFHGEHGTKSCLRNAPFFGNTRRGKRNRQHVEAIHGIEENRNRYHRNLGGRHCLVFEYLAWVCSWGSWHEFSLLLAGLYAEGSSVTTETRRNGLLCPVRAGV